MSNRCCKCNQELPKKTFLTCSVCSNSYDIDCAGAEKLFFIMEDKGKRQLKCQPCLSKMQAPHTGSEKCAPGIGPVISTPLGEYVTMRKKYQLNIEISNSFDSLADSISDEEDEVSSSSFRNKLNRSCPELSKVTTQDCEDMKKIIFDLQEKLAIAQKEIETLLLENGDLKKVIKENDSKINRLKRICNSNSKKDNTRANTHRDQSSVTRQGTLNPQSHMRHQSFDNLNTRPGKEDLPLDTISPSSKKEVNLVQAKKPKKNIFILGDQQIRGLAIKLIETRLGKWNDVYHISSIVKPSAPSLDILTNIEPLLDVITKDDIIILAVGSNDKDPFLLYSNLCNAIYKLNGFNVFVTSVFQNRYLNVEKLNFDISRMIKNYQNATFIHIELRDLGPKMYLKQLTFKLNIEVDYLKYKHDFIDNLLRTGTYRTIDKSNGLVKKISVDNAFFGQSLIEPQKIVP